VEEKPVSAALASLLLVAATDPSPPPSLEGRLAPLARAHKGRVAIAVKNLETGESYYLNADEVMSTASLIKVAVLFEAYQQADEGKIKLKERLTLRDADKVPGSGVLRENFSDGSTFTLRDAVRLMITFSDNTATNLVLERVGIRDVNRRMEEWGFPNTRVNALSYRASTTSIDPERSRRYGLGSTTAREALGLFEELATGTRFRPASRQAMLGHLRRNTDRDKFPRLLPYETPVWHKDGSTERVRTDAGLIQTPGGVVAVCVLTGDNDDRRWHPDNAGNLLCARVAREVYDHFAATASHPPTR
jgi:beta-lactamase class A